MGDEDVAEPPVADAGWSFSDAGHLVLDGAGLVPGYGEAADVANALWYIAEDNYLDAGLSLISCVPVVGDAIGKGGKIVKKVGVEAAQRTALGRKAVNALRDLDVTKALEPFKKNPDLAPHIEKIEKALNEWLERMFPCRKAAAISAKAAHPLTGKSASEVIAEAEKLGLDTKPDMAMLWSGLGEKGVEKSQEYARTLGGTTLEMTPGGRWLDGMRLFEEGSPFTRKEAMEIWAQVSKKFAGKAQGQVRVLTGKVRPDSVYRSIELPEMMSSGKVIGVEEIQVSPRF